MKVIETTLPGVLLIETRLFKDDRGFFAELFNGSRYAEHGIVPTVQDNFSRSKRGTLRGMHFQEPHAQGKLVTALRLQPAIATQAPATIANAIAEVQQASAPVDKQPETVQ